MGKNSGNALEALDLIVGVLKEHEKELSRLIGELKGVVERLASLEEAVKRMEGGAAEPSPPRRPEGAGPAAEGPLVVLRFKSWEEFREAARGSEAASYLVREGEGEALIQVEALKGRMLLTYVGPLPKEGSMIKSWLSGELGAPRAGVFEGLMRGAWERGQAD